MRYYIRKEKCGYSNDVYAVSDYVTVFRKNENFDVCNA